MSRIYSKPKKNKCHGFEAEQASKEAENSIMENYQNPLDKIIEETHKRLRKTRGAAISIALIDEEEHELHYVCIGNVNARVFNSKQPIRPVNFNGIVGINLNRFKMFQYPWSSQNIIIISSDGISQKYEVESYPGLLDKHPVVIADVLFRDFSREIDDATIFVGGPV